MTYQEAVEQLYEAQMNLAALKSDGKDTQEAVDELYEAEMNLLAAEDDKI